jgi:thiamine phosphate synthase YjbQ (UPF0047 family)
MLFLKRCYVNTTDEVDVIPITHDLRYAIRDSKSSDGMITVTSPEYGVGFVMAPAIKEVLDEIRASIEVFGAEGGIVKDRLKRERELGPIIQSIMLGKSIHLIFEDGDLIMDVCDEIYLFDFLKKRGRREFLIQVIADTPTPKKQ